MAELDRTKLTELFHQLRMARNAGRWQAEQELWARIAEELKEDG